jgi:1,4-alpha-glucan branching enzyme
MSMVVRVKFMFPQMLAPRARRVAVISSFNGWDDKAHPLTKTSNGDWSITVFLPPGRVVYCFSVDGVPWLDPGDEGRVANGWGSEYSVRFVRDFEQRDTMNRR